MYNLPARKTILRAVNLSQNQQITLNGYFSFIHVLSSDPLYIEITDLNTNQTFEYEFSSTYQLGRGIYNIRIKNLDNNVIQVIYGELE